MAAAWPQSLQGSALGSAAYGSYPYGSGMEAYGYGGAYGLAATRKNVTRESTATLKAWLNEHKKNPYPTKGEKIMLAIISKMTLTQVSWSTGPAASNVRVRELCNYRPLPQVSCWFANARRRLKKENKMTWEPKNGLNDEDVDVSDEEDGDNSFNREDKPNALGKNTRHRFGPIWQLEYLLWHRAAVYFSNDIIAFPAVLKRSIGASRATHK